MMKTKKTTGKFVSVLSVVLALAMLSTTVFASGVLAGLTEDTYTVEITNNGEAMELVNKPFIESGQVYVPLREVIEKVGYNETNSYITWNDGTIDIALLNDSGENSLCRLKIGSAFLQLMRFQGNDLYGVSMGDETMTRVSVDISHGNAPVLKGSTTYIPLDMANYILYSFLNIMDENNVLRELGYTIYDNAGNNITEMVKAES